MGTMRCNHCDGILDFAVMKRKNFLETGKTHLTVCLVFQNTPEIRFRDGIKVMTGSLDLLGVFTEPERAYEIKDMQDAYWEDRREKSERPLINVEEVQINHHWAWCMFQEMLTPRNLEDDMLYLHHKQDWNTLLGDIDLSVLDDMVVKKLLLKYSSIKETFYLRDFITEMDVPKELAKKCADFYINSGTFDYYEKTGE